MSGNNRIIDITTSLSCASVIGCVLAFAALAGFCAPLAYAASDVKSFPDEWFFEGAARPPALCALEGKPASPLAIDSWIGNAVSLADNRGKVVVVDFWATWCGPCMASIPHNVELVKKYADQGMVFVGVHDSNNGWSSAAQVVKDKGINYPVGVDKSGGPTVKDYALQFWPTYVVIDRSGTIRAAGLTPDKVEDVVKSLLAENAPMASADATSEFGAEYYLGGLARPTALKDIEGKPAPAPTPSPKAEAWIGTAPSPIIPKSNVVVLTFVSPTLTLSMSELDKMLPLQKEFAPQGVVFLGVCDGRNAERTWSKMQAYAKAKSLPMPIMQDAVTTQTGPAGKPTDVSATAVAFGIEFFPATVVIDRAGVVRAAGVRADKVKAVVEKLLGETVAEKPADAPK